MSGTPAQDLQELLRALAKERSLRGRLRVLGHSWELLRSLSRAEREQVALRIGSKWAWKRVEKTFLRDGELSENEELVGRAFASMGDADPGELRKMARMIREGDAAGAKDMLMMTLTEALEEEAEEDEADVAVDEVEGENLLTVSELVDRAEDVMASTLAKPVEEQAAVQVPKAAPVVQVAPVAPAAPAARKAPKPPVAKPEPVAPRAFPQPTQAREPEPPAPPAREQPRAPEPLPSPDFADFELSGPRDGIERLRVLRSLQRSETPVASLDRAGRAALLESLGGGWASRRALTRMIQTSSLDGLDEALHLIRHLVRPGQQAWCLGDLLAHWPLDDSERERILEAAPTDAARRRLALRSAALGSAR